MFVSAIESVLSFNHQYVRIAVHEEKASRNPARKLIFTKRACGETSQKTASVWPQSTNRWIPGGKKVHCWGRNVLRICAPGVRKWAFDKPYGRWRLPCAPIGRPGGGPQVVRGPNEIDNFADNLSKNLSTINEKTSA